MIGNAYKFLKNREFSGKDGFELVLSLPEGVIEPSLGGANALL